ncbi:DUF1896 family protein [uncultured Alistipes sp.]|uniref:DUF1896 family protein n=1 Tax=uncultured Alistipes sp. TaxID=538949 RepID=UPI002596EB12|nr:DUF1896 family protein [uncultured Alistipes sp.]
MERRDEPWFRQRLERFLRERHPHRQFREATIAKRSRLAYETYADRIRDGYAAEIALRKADEQLFRGWLFSKFDTVSLLLATDYPQIDKRRRYGLTIRLLRLLAPIFSNYPVGDHFAAKPEFGQLKEELRSAIRRWIVEAGIME